MSLDEKRVSQLVAAIILSARLKAAYTYLHTFLLHLIGFLFGLGMETFRSRPRWSEFERGGMVSQDNKLFGEERNTRSIRDCLYLMWQNYNHMAQPSSINIEKKSISISSLYIIHAHVHSP